MAEKTIVNIFSSHFLPHVGGVEVFTDNLAQVLSRTYHVNIIASNSEHRQFVENLPNNVRIYSLSSWFKLFADRFPIPYSFKEFNTLSTQLYPTKKKTVTIINTRFETTSLLGLHLAKKHHSQAILIEHGSAHLSVKNKFLSLIIELYEHVISFFIRKLYPQTIYFAVSKSAATWLKHFKITCPTVNIINGIMIGASKPPGKKPHSQFTIFIGGRLLKEKGYLEVIEACKKLDSKQFVLKIAGFGELESLIKTEIEDYPNIVFLGKLDQTTMQNNINQADLLINASSFIEGLPTLLLQSGLAQTPILSTVTGGAGEIIIYNQTGFILDKVDSSHIKERIVFIKNHQSLAKQYSQNLLNKIHCEYDFEKNTKLFINKITGNL